MSIKNPLILIMIIAMVLRGVAIIPVSLHHPDEVFQYLEQAHRLIFGYGVIPWEYRYGMRSWLPALLLAGPMQLGAWLAPATLLYIKLPLLLTATTSLSIIWSAWSIGNRSHPSHGLVAAVVIAIWFEQIFFASHPLTEVFATACFLPAAVLLTNPVPSRRNMLGAGVLLGLTAILRIQYAPAIAVLVLFSSKFDVRQRWLPIMAGGVLALAFSASLDIAMSQTPFGWVIENIQQNLILNKSSQYGVSSPQTYFAFLLSYWHYAAIPIILMTIPTVRNNQVFLWVALINILIHAIIGHKEYRFILLSTTIIIIFSSIGSVQLFNLLSSRLNISFVMLTCIPILIIFWSSVSAMLAIANPMKLRWNAYGPNMELAHRAGLSPGICGLEIHKIMYWESGGYTYLHKDIPIYLSAWDTDDAMSTRDMRKNSQAYNAIISSPRYIADIPSRYVSVTCAGHGRDPDDPTQQQCLYVRPGNCDPKVAAEWKIDQVLLRYDQ